MERANADIHKTPETPFRGGLAELRVGPRVFYTRPARPDDRDYCQQLHKTNMYALISTHWGWDPNRFDDDFVLSEVRVIETDGTVCGFYRLSIVDEHLYVDDLQVSSEWQGLGIGSALLDTFDGLALRKRLDRIRLMVFAENLALQLYQRHGYVTLSDRSGTLLMEKCLAPSHAQSESEPTAD